jgi:hypothetical protein
LAYCINTTGAEKIYEIIFGSKQMFSTFAVLFLRRTAFLSIKLIAENVGLTGVAED